MRFSRRYGGCGRKLADLTRQVTGWTVVRREDERYNRTEYESGTSNSFRLACLVLSDAASESAIDLVGRFLESRAL